MQEESVENVEQPKPREYEDAKRAEILKAHLEDFCKLGVVVQDIMQRLEKVEKKVNA